MVRSADLENIIGLLNTVKNELNLQNEVKWQRVTEQYLEKYIILMDRFFDLIESDKVKIRIMFTQNYHVPTGLTKDHRENEYHILYYLFIKNAFGLIYSNNSDQNIGIRINLDQLPDNKEKNDKFKSYIHSLNSNPKFKQAKLQIKEDQIAEVDSKHHVILQCLDIVLGSMAFRLNDKHKEKAPGSSRRGKRTIAKEKLYKHINLRIRKIYPNFNIGSTTGRRNGAMSQWEDPYRHWKMVPENRTVDPSKAKH